MESFKAGSRLVSTIFILLALYAGNVFATGLANPGFEDGVLDGHPTSWTVAAEADTVRVVDAESPGEFPAYAESGITVTPFAGEYMLRLGNPKTSSESQDRGDNTVTQTFVTSSDTYTFNFRLFSREFRKVDRLVIDVKGASNTTVSDETGGPLSISFGKRGADSCDTTPCTLMFGTDKKDLQDTGWKEVVISGLPEGESVTLEYTLVGDDNNSHASWAYFDKETNHPPVAQFNFSDGVLEGGMLSLMDESYDPDPGDSVVTWEWRITETGLPTDPDPTAVKTEQNPTIIIPDDGEFFIHLRVTDSFGASSEELIKPLSVENTAPLVNALNQQVLVDTDTELFGRFIDLGWVDTHTASWSITGGTENQNLEETNGIPFSAIGTASADFLAPSAATSLTGSLTITDNLGISDTDSFTLDVLDASAYETLEASREEGNNTLDPDNTPALESGWVYRSSIANVSDVDIYEILLPDADNDGKSDAGSEVLLKLKDLPADFDLVLLSYLPEDGSTTAWLQTAWLQTAWLQTAWLQTAWLQTAWLQTAWLQTAWLQTAWLQTAWLQTAWLQTPWDHAAWLQTAWLQTAWLQTAWLQTAWLQTAWLQTGFIDQIPLSDLAQLELRGEAVGGSDLSVSELGLDSLLIPGASIAAFSANRGLEDETVIARTDLPGTRMFAVVISNNGGFSPTPYALQVETSEPVDVESLLGAQCEGDAKVSSAAHLAGLSGSGTPRTLFVTQKDRIDAISGAGSWASIQAQLDELGVIEESALLNIDNAVYDDWDNHPCSIEAANEVSHSIREAIVDVLTGDSGNAIEYVVFIGSDDIIPYRRVPDETAISNERGYVQESRLKPGTPLYMSMYHGNNLTDDYYVDNLPIALQGRELYVPKLSVARLVETPDQISAAIAAFVSSGGTLTLDNALVTGYDFFTDGAEESADNLFVTPYELIDEFWTLEQLRCAFLGSGTGCEAHDINNVNAHYNHYGAITAFGYNFGDNNDVLSSQEVFESGTPLLGSLNFTIGCHSGLSVPDGSAEGGQGANLDFPQAMSQNAAVYVGSTGFGLGDDTGVAGTEKLIALFSGELIRSCSVGKALTRAKQDYIGSLSTITAYDEKSSIQTTMYGLPMYRIAGVTKDCDALEFGLKSANTRIAMTAVPDSFDANDHVVDLVTKADGSGSYYTMNGESQITPWRPIQPKLLEKVTGSDQKYPWHGVLVTGGTYNDSADGFDPVIARPRQEWALDPGEPVVCLNAFWPSTIASVNSLPLVDGSLAQNLLLVPGQFRCTSGSGSAPVTGIQRNFTSLQLGLTRSDSEEDEDFTAPTINEVDLSITDTGVQVSIDAWDDVGSIEQIVLLVFDNGELVPYQNFTGTGPYVIDDVQNVDGAQMLLQVADSSGNVATWTAKGVNTHLLDVHASGTMFSEAVPATLTGAIADFDILVSEAPSVFYRWEFGDGTYAFGILAENGVVDPAVTVDTDGTGRFDVEHAYTVSHDVIATLKITDAIGGIGTDDVTLRFCGDSADLAGPLANLDYVGCGISNDVREVTITLVTEAPFSTDAQYRIHLDLDNDGSDDEMLKYNASNGSATGIKPLKVVEVDDSTLEFTFNLPKKWNGDSFGWYAETQDGVSGGAGQGFVDRMPDAGYFTHIVQ